MNERHEPNMLRALPLVRLGGAEVLIQGGQRVLPNAASSAEMTAWKQDRPSHGFVVHLERTAIVGGRSASAEDREAIYGMTVGHCRMLTYGKEDRNPLFALSARLPAVINQVELALRGRYANEAIRSDDVRQEMGPRKRIGRLPYLHGDRLVPAFTGCQQA